MRLKTEASCRIHANLFTVHFSLPTVHRIRLEYHYYQAGILIPPNQCAPS